MRKTLSSLRVSLLAAAVVLLGACQNETETMPEVDEGTVADTSVRQVAEMQESATRINLNTATEAEFSTIPGVDERMVDEFMEYRPYASIGEFREEIGKYVSEQQVAAYEEYVFVPIRIDDSDAETLQQLPGVDADEAAQLVAARPYASRDAFLTKLAEFASAEEVAQAEPYLAR